MTSLVGRYVDAAELETYTETVAKYQRGEINEDKLMVVRLQQGVYGQRQDGVNMVRIKLPGGRLLPAQLAGLADILQQDSSEDIISITTRQDLQLHSVKLENTPTVLHALADLGLTTREACGNTVRNICACPLAGVCEREHVDVQPFIEQTVSHFLRHRLTQHMPRKIKMSFSGCELDCAQGMIHDVGVVAIRKDNRFGFKILAAGGLGHKPREAIVIEPFVDEVDLLPVIEAVIAVHNKYSQRKKRAKSRVKFLVDRFGEQGFIERYQVEVKKTRAAYANVRDYVSGNWVAGSGQGEYGAGAPRTIVAQKQAGRFVFPIAVPLGDLSAEQLRAIAGLLLELNIDDIRTTQDQNLILVGVSAASFATIRERLAEIGLANPVVGDNVVACPGTWTCRLGITASKNIAEKLNGFSADLKIRVSGCHNGCAQPTVADIGIHGEGKRLYGKLIPHYRLFFGGDGRAGGGIGVKGPEVPAARIAKAIERIRDTYMAFRVDNETFRQWSTAISSEKYDDLLADLIYVSENDLAEVLYDHGDELEFKVSQFGGGECAGVSHEDVAANFSEAAMERNYLRSFLLAREYVQAIECARAMTHLVAKSLLRSLKQDDSLDELKMISTRLKEQIPSHAHLYESLAVFAQQLGQFESSVKDTSNDKLDFDVVVFEHFLEILNGWIVAAGHFCQEKNPTVDLLPSLPQVFFHDVQKQDITVAQSRLPIQEKAMLKTTRVNSIS